MAFWSSWFSYDEPVAPPPAILRVTTAGLELIRASEGYSAVPYMCAAGVPTIGWGTTIDINGLPITLDHPPIDLEYAHILFSRDVRLFGAGVKKLVKVPVNKRQYSALVSFAYNLGLGNLQASTLLRKLNRSDYIGASGQFKWWRKANGEILRGLVIRRALERDMFLS